MKTTLDLPDELMRAIKMRAAKENRKLKDLIAELLRQGLAVQMERSGGRGHRVELPLIRVAHTANRDEEMTPDRVSKVLLEEEASRASAR
jgi:hypothetical protein